MEAIETQSKPWQFTRENAAEMARKGNAIRYERERLAKLTSEQITQATLTNDDDPLRKDTIEQIQQLNADFKATKDVKTRIMIATAKDKLWRLIFPSPGSLKPKSPKSPRQSSNAVEPEAE